MARAKKQAGKSLKDLKRGGKSVGKREAASVRGGAKAKDQTYIKVTMQTPLISSS